MNSLQFTSEITISFLGFFLKKSNLSLLNMYNTIDGLSNSGKIVFGPFALKEKNKNDNSKYFCNLRTEL